MINIDDLLGVKYKVNGRDLNGFDCMGLAIEVERRFGHELPDLEGNMKAGRCFSEQTEKTLKVTNIVETTSPKEEGDIILFLNSKGVLHHIGIYLGNNQFIHCNFCGVHIERLSSFPDKVGRIYRWL